ncbi:MAG: anthranilate phosphoribosyltransferase [Gammaproteobacteria bacterium]|nr:anthranilate phosphoribosyltransferase [Gammaproteobacteria bacterium]
MDMQAAIRAVTENRSLNRDEMSKVMRLIMTGEATPAQIGGFLIGLRMKGETVDEIAAAAGVMRDLAQRVEVADVPNLVDTCGTGGDSARTFNISTAAAIVAAAAGAHVAKHGNRSVSSRSGSADVLEALGVKLDLNAGQVAHCIREIGIGFMFAPSHHGAMKHAIGPRREMGVRTVFNLLGPLTNPAHAPNQVIGVFDKKWVEPMVRVLRMLGSRHVLVAHAEDGMDEISIGGPTVFSELKEGKVHGYTITPEQFGIPRGDIKTLAVDSAAQSAEVIRRVFANTPGAARDIVAMNAGAAIYVSGLTRDLRGGIAKAFEALAHGAAQTKLNRLIEISHAC